MSGMMEGLAACFTELADPRETRRCDHRLIDILAIAVCAVIACAESWEDIALYGRSRRAWLETFLELPNGIPSHDTFRRVFMLIDPDASRCASLDGCRPGPVGSRVRWWPWTAKPSGAQAAAATIMGPCTWSAPGQASRGWRLANVPSTASRTRSPRSRSCLRPCTWRAAS